MAYIELEILEGIMKTHLHCLRRPAPTHALLSIDIASTYIRHGHVSYCSGPSGMRPPLFTQERLLQHESDATHDGRGLTVQTGRPMYAGQA